MKRVWINVALREGCEDPDGAEGLWEVSLNQDCPEGVVVPVAKDVFHRRIGIRVLDDFIIDVLSPDTKERLKATEDYVNHSVGGDVERIGDPLELA